jgi:hypothetical protein
LKESAVKVVKATKTFPMSPPAGILGQVDDDPASLSMVESPSSTMVSTPVPRNYYKNNEFDAISLTRLKEAEQKIDRLQKENIRQRQEVHLNMAILCTYLKGQLL